MPNPGKPQITGPFDQRIQASQRCRFYRVSVPYVVKGHGVTHPANKRLSAVLERIKAGKDEAPSQ